MDGTNVYWVNWGTSGNNFTDGNVMKITTNGTSPMVLASTQDLPVGIAIDATRVYWSHLERRDRDEHQQGRYRSGAASANVQNSPHDIAVFPSRRNMNATTVYWANEGTTTLGHMDSAIVQRACAGAAPPRRWPLRGTAHGP